MHKKSELLKKTIFVFQMILYVIFVLVHCDLWENEET